MTKRASDLFAGLLLCLLAVQVTGAMRTTSPTSDEFSHHIANGYSYLKTWDFRMNPGPSFPRLLVAVPLAFLGAKLPPKDDPSWVNGNSPEFAKQFFTIYNTDLDRLVFWARVPIVLLSLYSVGLYFCGRGDFLEMLEVWRRLFCTLFVRTSWHIRG